MRIYLTAAILLGLLAGCSSDQGSTDNSVTTAASNALQKSLALPAMAGSPMSSFASMPDRGELLTYEQNRAVKHRGAYTSYPVSLSEAHALHAMQTGQMVIKAPNGELLRLKYESHVESPDGNWSWIGRNADGATAILTFGEKAVFGTIPQGASDVLRLTMNAGQAWLVQTDRSKLAGLDGATRRSGTDQLIPPKLAAAAMSTASMRAESVGATPAAATAVVDVLLGYTNGLSAQLGSESAAITRLNFLIVTTNQAYANSGVNMRVRLVKTMSVAYPDNTDNGDALEKLTGYKSGGGAITPDPAFNALRAAREETGADLVSLVRPFRTPENNGCGIAWLIGGGGKGDFKKEDAPFGYSVVSDGVDKDEGDKHEYYCRDETLAHELGHNMGQAHNKEDSKNDDGSQSYGVHPYSFGYREASTTGFYTVMAYPLKDGSQSAIPYFANPAVMYSDRATGVANESDNTRSLNITMPIVSTFRNTVVPVLGNYVRADMNGDGRSDIIWRNPTTQQTSRWFMNGPALIGGQADSLSSDYNIVGIGDFDGDGRSDLLMVNNAKTQVIMWRPNANGAYVGNYVADYPAGNWTVVMKTF